MSPGTTKKRRTNGSTSRSKAAAAKPSEAGAKRSGARSRKPQGSRAAAPSNGSADARRVADVMTTDPVALLEVDTCLDAAQAMRENDVGDVIVLDDTTAHVCGILTDRDIVMRCIAEGKRPEMTTIGAIASGDLVSVTPDDDLDDVLRLMRDRAVRRVPVVDSGRPVGILSLGDLALERHPDSALAEISRAPANS